MKILKRMFDNIIDEINSSVQRYTEQTGYGTVTEILKKKRMGKRALELYRDI